MFVHSHIAYHIKPCPVVVAAWIEKRHERKLITHFGNFMPSSGQKRRVLDHGALPGVKHGLPFGVLNLQIRRLPDSFLRHLLKDV